MNQIDTHRYQTPDQVCAWFNISASTRDRLVRKGEFPKPVLIGSSRRWLTEALYDHERKLEQDAK